MLKSQKGFTLIELMVVVAILGLLAGIMIPIFSGVQERAEENIHKTHVAMLQSAGNLYVVMEGVPTAAQVWKGETGEGANEDWKKFFTDWKAGYVVTIGTDGSVVVTVE